MIKRTQQHLDPSVAARIIGQYSNRIFFLGKKQRVYAIACRNASL
jgi:hypothetical protein